MTTAARATVDLPSVCQRRDAVLREPQWFPSNGVVIENSVAETLTREAAHIGDRLNNIGVALFQLTRPLDTAEFIALGTSLGVPERETDQSLMQRVANGVILNITSDDCLPVTECTQPFTTQPLTYHIEGSRRPAGTAPAYLLFQCLQRPVVDSGGQTILRSIPDTITALSEATRTVLAGTVLNPELTTATVICERTGRMTLNFRDPAPAEFLWRSPYPDGDVIAALTELLWVIYDPAGAVGVPWRDGMVAIVDNDWWLHARTGGCPGERHLQRIRIQARRNPT